MLNKIVWLDFTHIVRPWSILFQTIQDVPRIGRKVWFKTSIFILIFYLSTPCMVTLSFHCPKIITVPLNYQSSMSYCPINILLFYQCRINALLLYQCPIVLSMSYYSINIISLSYQYHIVLLMSFNVLSISFVLSMSFHCLINVILFYQCPFIVLSMSYCSINVLSLYYQCHIVLSMSFHCIINVIWSVILSIILSLFTYRRQVKSSTEQWREETWWQDRTEALKSDDIFECSSYWNFKTKRSITFLLMA